MADPWYQRHVTSCPHCGRDVLDHMEQCPFCKGELTPLSGQGIPKETQKRIKKWLSIIGYALAAGVLLWRLLR